MSRPVLIDNFNQIRLRMRSAAARVGRNPDAVRLVAVTKYAPLESVREALESELISEAGESRVQDAEKKIAQLGPAARRAKWRMIGHLQTNKARAAARLFDAVDSLDSERAAQALEAALIGGEKILPVLIQVKLSDRQTQHGVSCVELPALIEFVRSQSRLRLDGLMMIAPHAEPVESVRPFFRELRELRDRHLPGGLLSMGMSRDFEIAIEEGADLVRIGTRIFSQLSPASLEAPE